MSDRGNTPLRELPVPPVIWPGARQSIGVELSANGEGIQPVTGTNPFAANDMIACEFVLPTMTKINKAFWLNGSAAGGNYAAAIYDADYNKIIQSASTGATGNNVPQSVAMACTLPAGHYYMALAHDSATTNQIFRWSFGNTGMLKAVGLWRQASVTLATLPNPATPAAFTGGLVPVYGITTRTVFDV